MPEKDRTNDNNGSKCGPHYTKIGIKNLLYTDTDSIYYTGETPPDITTNSEEIGTFRIEHTNENMTIWGNKTYSIADEIRAAGVWKTDLKNEDFQKGIVQTRKMHTIKTNEPNLIGTFYTNTHDLKDLPILEEEIRNLAKNEKYIRDKECQLNKNHIQTLNKLQGGENKTPTTI